MAASCFQLKRCGCRGVSYFWRGDPTGRGPGSGPFFSQQGVSSDLWKGPHSCPSRGHVKHRGSSPHPSPTSADSFKAWGWPGRGQRAEVIRKESRGQSTIFPLVDASKTDLCHEAHPPLKSAGPTPGELGVGAGMRRPGRRTSAKGLPGSSALSQSSTGRPANKLRDPDPEQLTHLPSSIFTHQSDQLIPQHLWLPLPSTPSSGATISHLHSCPLTLACLHSAARESLIKGDSGPAIPCWHPIQGWVDRPPHELDMFAFSSFTGLSGIFHCRRK